MVKNFMMMSIFFIMAVLFPFELFAAGVNVGANLWYAWTEPGFKEQMMGKNDIANRNNNFEMTTPAALVYGGLFSAQFTDRLSMGGVFSYGAGWEGKADYLYNPTGTELHMYKTLTKMERFEGDLTINYTLTNIFKLFLGWKFFGERGDGNYQFTLAGSSAVLGSGEFEFLHKSTGPGLGLTSIFHIADNLYLITTLSGIYQRSNTTIKSTGYSTKETDSSDSQLGGNGLLNLAYVLPDLNVTFSLGGRYQYLRSIDEGTGNKFYGVLLSAIYAFEI